MLVRDWMTRAVVTLEVGDSMQDAGRLMKEKNVRMLPVLDKGRLVGVVTDRDLKRASASDATALEIHELLYLVSRIQVKDIMSKNVVTVPVDFTIEETAEILMKNKISGVPVVDHQRHLAGIITQTDIFKVILSLTGIQKRGILFAFCLQDQSGSIKAVADVIRGFGGRMASILTSYENVPEGQRMVFIRIYGVAREKLPALVEALRLKNRLLYMVDHAADHREIYADEA
ncbi:MAG: CBS and ACT domain-containing protein [Desulfobacteraceae bacterium]|jgi:acetoin utilization protein AcuB